MVLWNAMILLHKAAVAARWVVHFQIGTCLTQLESANFTSNYIISNFMYIPEGTSILKLSKACENITKYSTA